MKALLAIVVLAACGSNTPPTRTERTPPPDAALAPALALDLARPVTAIRVEGLGARTTAARAAITTQVGDVVDALKIRADQAALWALGGLATLEVTAIAAEDGVELVFAATERPRVEEITIWGWNQQKTLVDPPRVFTVEVGDVFDPAAAHRARDLLVEAYRDVGFAFADATWSFAKGELRVDITEGKQVAIQSITFRGNSRFTAKQLLATLTKGTGAAVGGPYVPYAFDSGLVYLNAAYYDVGHILIETGPTEAKFDADGTLVDLVIPIEEGAQHKVGKISFSGELVDTEKHARAILGVKSGDVFSRSKLAAGLDTLTALHHNNGYPHAVLTPLTVIDDVKHTVDLTISIERGMKSP